MEKRTAERKRSGLITGGPGYRSLVRWRFAGIGLIPIMVLATALNISSHPTWTWALPWLAVALYIVSAVFLWRSRSPKQSALAALGQMVFTIGALALIAVPVNM